MLPAILIIASVFAFLIYRLASAHFKNKLGEIPSRDAPYGDVPALPDDLKSRACHSAPLTDGAQQDHV